MTTIKLRRGLSTAFSTNNPILAAGEPAFATDTGILKIGDGTTAYNSLPSIGASPDLSNYVTTNTEQTINNVKTFALNRGSALYDYTGAINGSTRTADGTCNFYLGATENSYNKSGVVLTRSENKYMGLFINTTVQNALRSGSGVHFMGTPTGSGSISGGTRMVISGGSTSLLLDNNGFTVNSNKVLDASCVDGTTITYDSNTGKISAAGSAPSNMVTTNTVQTITGYKTFNEGITIAKDGLIDPSISMTDGTTSATVLSLQYGNTDLLTLTGAPDINITASGKLAFSGNPTNVVRNRAGVEYEMLDVSMVDGTTITYDANTGKISAAGGGGGASIDDNNTSPTTTFSSQKIVNTITQASTDVLDEVADEFVASTDIRNMVKLTQAQYDALATKDANTFYIIVAASS